VIHLTRCSVLVFTDVLVENHARAIKPETSPEVLRFAQDDSIDQAISSTPQRLTVVVMKALRGVLLMVLIFPGNSCPDLVHIMKPRWLGQPERLLAHSTLSRSYLPYG
jgi:hypothetical protein